MADQLLDADADALLAELAQSQEEVQRLISAQREQATELGDLKDNLAAELHELQEEAWKLQVYGELEALKRQLAALKGLEDDLDAAEAVLDSTEPDAPEAGVRADGATALQDNVPDDDSEDYNPEEIAEMQAKLDAELAEMFSQLQAVKAEAAAVSARKALLEAELKALIEDGGAGLEELEGEADQGGLAALPSTEAH